jgi:hypothetical protein
MMVKSAKEAVSSEISGAKVGSGPGDERFGVYVSFVDGEQQVLGVVFGGDRKTAGKVGEYSVTAEFGGGFNPAAE